MNLLQDNVLQDRVEAYIDSRPAPPSSGGITSIVAGDNITVDVTDPANPVINAVAVGSSLTPQAEAFLTNPSANSFSIFLGETELTGSGQLVRSTNPSLIFGSTSGRILLTGAGGAVSAATEATDAATANSVVRRNSSGGFNFSGAISSNTAGASLTMTGSSSSVVVNGSIGLSSSGFTVRLVAPVLSSNVDLTLASTTGTILTGTPNAIAFLNNPTSANLRTLMADETGSNNLVFSNNPTLTNPVITDFTETEVNLGNIAGSVGISLAAGTKFRATMTANCTFSLPSVSASNSKSFCLLLSTNANNLTAFFTGVFWPDGIQPVQTPTAWRRDFYTFTSINGQWFGSVVQNYA